MTTLMVTLTVFRPRGQAPEVFHDSTYEELLKKTSTGRQGEFRVYSYKVFPDNVLKVYSHKVDMRWKNWDPDQATDGMEIAHFRPNQWDTVRSGTPTHH